MNISVAGFAIRRVFRQIPSNILQRFDLHISFILRHVVRLEVHQFRQSSTDIHTKPWHRYKKHVIGYR